MNVDDWSKIQVIVDGKVIREYIAPGGRDPKSTEARDAVKRFSRYKFPYAEIKEVRIRPSDMSYEQLTELEADFI